MIETLVAGLCALVLVWIQLMQSAKPAAVKVAARRHGASRTPR